LVGEHRDRADPQLGGGTKHPDRDLAAIGDQQGAYRLHRRFLPSLSFSHWLGEHEGASPAPSFSPFCLFRPKAGKGVGGEGEGAFTGPVKWSKWLPRRVD